MLVLILKLCVSVFRSIIKPEVLFRRLEVQKWPGLKFVIRVSSVLGPLMWQWASADGNCWAEEEEEADTPLCNIVSAPEQRSSPLLGHSSSLNNNIIPQPRQSSLCRWTWLETLLQPKLLLMSPNLYLFASVPDFPRLCFYFIELR